MKFIKTCNRCNLHINQKPLLDNSEKCDVMWIGLSAKKVENVEAETPLGISTNSGKIINKIETQFDKINFYKTNLVKCLPLDENNKLRYPTNYEKLYCYSNLKKEVSDMNPKIVFLLGKDVANFVLRQENYKENKCWYKINETYYVPIHHPSYIYVYKKKYTEQYINEVCGTIKKLCSF